MDKYLIAIYWNERRKSLFDCVKNLIEIFQKLSEIDSSFRNLKYVKSKGKLPIDFSQLEVEELGEIILRDKINEIKKYNPGKIIDLTFSEPVGFSLWFEADQPKNYTVGANLGAFHPNISNSFLIDFSPNFTREFNWYKKIMVALIDKFEPLWGGIYSQKFLVKNELNHSTLNKVGWINYLSNEIEFDFPIIEGEVIKLKKGKLIQLLEENFDIDNPKHLVLLQNLFSEVNKNN